MKYARGKQDARRAWIHGLRERRGTKVAAVALANQQARMLWARLAQHDAYRSAV
ncbi:MAG TPA: hypothetical protein VES89_03640 [Candidatus Competibacteraceae bacterium]|nr:hypothetical protein [Candidatus Competibacteraceae bacterium]